MHITAQIISDHLKAPEVGLKTFLVNKIITGAFALPIFTTKTPVPLKISDKELLQNEWRN